MANCTKKETVTLKTKSYEKIKPLDLSSREEIGRDEMRNMTAHASSGTSASGSGSGSSSVSGYDRDKERELQKEACNGKTVDASMD